MARQGVPTLVSGQLRVIGPDGAEVPADGQTLGELAIRGNTVMSGYYRNEAQTVQAIPDGWFRTGDLAVRHPDSYVEVRDRSKDIIISGGENIASVEVEQALASHPAVFEVAVVAAPHPRWGEVPVAFVQLAPGASASADELIAHVRERVARFKAPNRVVFGDLPRTATGKVQKFKLRQRCATEPTSEEGEA
jgi:fatty-acyl-CoA synthase